MKPNTQEKETRSPGRDRGSFQSKRIEMELIEKRLSDLRSRIDGLGQQIDSYRAKTAAALGGGVFLILLAAGAGYEIAAGKSGIWLSLGVTAVMLRRLAFLFAIAGAALVALAIMRERRRDLSREASLDELEEEFAELLTHKESMSQLADETPPQTL